MLIQLSQTRLSHLILQYVFPAPVLSRQRFFNFVPWLCRQDRIYCKVWRSTQITLSRKLLIGSKVLVVLAITLAPLCFARTEAAQPQKPAERAIEKPKVTLKSNQVKSSPTQVAHGQKLFERLTCAGCHPNGGNTLHPYRPLKGAGFLTRYKEDGQIEHLIRKGVPTAGMPAFSKAQLNDKDMTDLIAFIRSLTPDSKK